MASLLVRATKVSRMIGVSGFLALPAAFHDSRQRWTCFTNSSIAECGPIIQPSPSRAARFTASSVLAAIQIGGRVLLQRLGINGHIRQLECLPLEAHVV